MQSTTPEMIVRLGTTPSRLAAGLGASLVFHLLVLFGLGHVLPAKSWQAPLGELTVFLASAPDDGEARSARRDTSALLRTRPATSPPPPDKRDADSAPATAGTVAPTGNLVSLALPQGVHYFPSQDLDRTATLINDVLLRYPDTAYRQGIAGEVTLRMFLNEGGTVDSVDVIKAEPEDLFEDAATEAALQLEYSPAIKDGMPVKSIKTIAIIFDPDTQPLR